MLTVDGLTAAAMEETGLKDFGSSPFREGLGRLTDALDEEADLTAAGTEILGLRLTMLLANRLRVEKVYAAHPEIGDQEVGGPVVIIGLPRTGTTALSQLVAADPQFRSLRLWESIDPVPPPTTETEHDDPRIGEAQRGLDAMYTVFPRMRSLYYQTATGATECQDLLGMAFRTEHFDGMAHVPSYRQWVLDCDMTPAYEYHRRVLRLLQWHCPPRLWHLKTPVHMLALDELCAVYPDAKFLWTHRDPAAVLGSVCSLIAYTRSWVSDRDDAAALGEEQSAVWAEALRRAMEFRDRTGEERFADVAWDELQTDPVGAVSRAYGRLGLDLGQSGRSRVAAWAADNPPGSKGAHEFALGDFGLEAAAVRRLFGFYLERFEVPVGGS
ncbi:MAG: sulfotransferase family protein [Acidimicrobiales bacterium]